MARATRNVVLGLGLACGVVLACGGQSIDERSTSRNGGSDTGGSGGDGGTTPGGTGGGTLGGASGVGGTSGIPGTGGAAGRPERCLLEALPGPCEGATLRYAYSARSGVCRPFTYGGCEGNANNFQSLDECYAVCGTDHPERTFCNTPFDCRLVPATCCATCFSRTLANVMGVNATEIEAVRHALGCDNVDCEGCQTEPVNAGLGVTCQDHRCVAFDASETPLGVCATDSDCRLRGGIGCCELCSARPEQFVPVNAAANASIETRELLCGNSAIGCDACVPVPPPGFGAACYAGRCLLFQAIE